MFRVICTLENASHEISGIAFEDHPSGGVISAHDLDADQAGVFRGINGYSIVDADDDEKPPAETAAEKRARKAAEKAAAEAAAAAEAETAAAAAAAAEAAGADTASGADTEAAADDSTEAGADTDTFMGSDGEDSVTGGADTQSGF